MSDPQQYGLSELGQRVQALSDPAPEPRLRPYQGGSLPGGAVANGRPAPTADEPAANPFAEVQVTDFRATAASTSYNSPAGPSPYASSYGPAGHPAAAPEAFSAYAQQFAAMNRSSANGSSSPHESSLNGYTPLHGNNPIDSMNPMGADRVPADSQATAATPAAASPIAAVDPNAPKTGLQKALEAVRSAIPLVQRLLPLLDGNFANTLNALVSPQTAHPPQPPVKVDLEPVERGLAEVRTSNRELRTQVQEQSTSLKRVEDQLERVREATDRNTLEQQELVEDLRSTGNRIGTFAIIGIVLLLVVLGVNVYFLIQLQHILR